MREQIHKVDPDSNLTEMFAISTAGLNMSRNGGKNI
jgi:hypothetical protein